MKMLRINKLPSGFAPLHIREKWVGVEIMIDKRAIVNHLPQPGLIPGILNKNKFIVMSADAISALKKAGHHEAAAYWENLPGGAMTFDTANAEIIIPETA